MNCLSNKSLSLVQIQHSWPPVGASTLPGEGSKDGRQTGEMKEINKISRRKMGQKKVRVYNYVYSLFDNFLLVLMRTSETERSYCFIYINTSVASLLAN